MAKSTLQSIPVSAGEIIDLQIESMAYDNAAVAHYKDFVIFVDRGAPGDLVQAQITTLRPNYARAKILEIKKSDSNYRLDPKCKILKVCGGCQWQHLPYEKQLEQKDLLVKNFFSKFDLPEGVLKNTIGAEQAQWNYRNKVQYPVRTVSETGRLKAGYFEWHSNELINVKHCPIQNNLFDEIIETVRELASKYKIVAYAGRLGPGTQSSGWLRHICVRAGMNTGEYLLTLVAVNEHLSRSQEFAAELMQRFPKLVGVCININTNTTNVIYGDKTKVIKGKGYLSEKVNDLRFKISATSFFQVNTVQAERLLKIIGEMIGGRDIASQRLDSVILDAYCGVGLFSLALSKYAKQVIGIEEIKQSIEDARFSAKENNIQNVTFINGKVENKINDLFDKNKIDIIVLDPPRAGCNKTILASIAEHKVSKIIYVSCNPSTLVRDVEILKSKNYKIKTIQPIDMFPHSYHIETVVLLEY